MCTPEAGVLAAILGLLAAEHVLAFRLNVGAMRVGRRFVRFGVPGMADVISFPRGRVLWIEAKAPENGRQSAEQISFQQQVESVGHSYIVARSSDDVLAFLRTMALRYGYDLAEREH